MLIDLWKITLRAGANWTHGNSSFQFLEKPPLTCIRVLQAYVPITLQLTNLFLVCFCWR